MFLSQILIEFIGKAYFFLENLVIVLLVQTINSVFGIRISVPVPDDGSSVIRNMLQHF